jgi:hypothetical protein
MLHFYAASWLFFMATLSWLCLIQSFFQESQKMTNTTSDDAAAIIAKLSKLTLSTVDIYKDAKSKALELSRKQTASLEDPVRRAINLAFQV